jgi:hypothetical protein
MFQNRISSFGIPPIGAQPAPAIGALPVFQNPSSQMAPLTVPIADIYQAARKRAVEDHELDKLFNPDYYDYQI